MTIRATELMSFQKFATTILKLTYHDHVRELIGIYSYDKTGEHYKEQFYAHPCGNAETTYKAYLKWFNYTIEDKFESTRSFIKASWVNQFSKDV